MDKVYIVHQSWLDDGDDGVCDNLRVFKSLESAINEFELLIEDEMSRIDSYWSHYRYCIDKYERSWFIYEDGYAASNFTRIDIYERKLED